MATVAVASAGRWKFPGAAPNSPRRPGTAAALLPDFRHSHRGPCLAEQAVVAAVSPADTLPSLPAPDATPLASGDDSQAVTLDLLRRYDKPGPRYTSYPDGRRVPRRLRCGRLCGPPRRRGARARGAAVALPAPAVLRGPLRLLRLLGDRHAEASRGGAVPHLSRSRDRDGRRGTARPPARGAVPLGRRHAELPVGGPDARAARRGTSALRRRSCRARSRSRSIPASHPSSSSRPCASWASIDCRSASRTSTPEVQEAVRAHPGRRGHRGAHRAGARARLRVDQRRPHLRPAPADGRLVRRARVETVIALRPDRVAVVLVRPRPLDPGAPETAATWKNCRRPR